LAIEHLPRLIAQKGKLLENAGIERGKGEIEITLCSLLQINRLELYLHGEQLINQSVLTKLDDIINKRLTRYPLQLILQEAWFYGRKFFVTPNVMVPTPETEILCETAMGFIKNKKYDQPKILDLGVGSGVISVTLAKELKNCSILAVDISSEALKIAQKNAHDLNAGDKIKFLQSDYFQNIPQDETFDLILANPPYISDEEYKHLPPEVLADPKISLTAGPEGMDMIKTIVRDAPDYLSPKGRLMFEIGYNQAEKVAQLTEVDNRYRAIIIIKDLNDIDRVVILSCDNDDDN